MELKTYFAQDASGNIMPGATVTVYEAGTATLATGLQDESGVPLANPFTADSSAKVAFYAPDGLYDITVVGNGRTVTIRAQFADLGAAVTAEKLKTARTIAITGDLSWSTSFDGSGNVTASGTLANSGVTTGTYRSVTVDDKGRVTAGSNPTTLSEYGITDAIDKTSATGMAYLPNGTTAQRDASPVGPGIRFNSTTGKFEGYDGSAWGDIGGGGDFSASLAGNGYQKLPSGLIIQWGSGTTTTGGPATWTFPVAFPNACLQIVATAQVASGTALAFMRATPSATSATVWAANDGGTLLAATVRCIAIGY